MKKLLLISLLFINVPFIFCQENIYGIISFKQVYNFNNEKDQKHFILYFNNYKSAYIEQKDSTINNDFELTKESDEELNISIKISYNDNNNTAYSIFTNLLNKKLEILSSIYEKGEYNPVIVDDKAARCTWRIRNEFKKVGRFDCQKAVTTFRGRTYTVWFTHEIPIGIGPWKLNGLPGAILEAFDKTGEIYFIAELIEIPYVGELEVMPEINSGNIDRISLREFIERENKLEDEAITMIMSKLPRGSDFQVDNVTRRDIELKYEFENK